MEDNKKFLKGFAGGILSATVIVALVIFISKYSNLSLQLTESNNSSDTQTNAQETVGGAYTNAKVDAIREIIDRYYLEDADENALVTGIYKGLVNGLGDPYSVYYTEDEYNRLMETTEGIYCGIGVSVSQNIETGIITLVKPFKNAPGFEAGILPGDILYKVNGEEVTGQDLTTVVAKIKGEEGTTVDLTVVRGNETDYIDITVERRQVEIPTIEYEMLDNNIGYILISEFDTVTQQQFFDAFTDLNNKGMQGLIVDLRDNPGGILDVVNSILDNILPEGLIVYTEDKTGHKEEYTSDAEHYFDKPLAVLINGNSASASEIFAGAVKDYDIGTLVGTTTYGKGIVQRLIELGDGTAMKLTISKYFTPNGNNIHGIGIEPDIEVELSDEARKKAVIEHSEDNQLQTAIEAVKEQITGAN